jgi:peptide/nickel transport system permease protein
LLVLGYLLIALIGPVLLPYDATLDVDLPNKLQSPTEEHPMGTDNLGRDIAIRILHGAPVSLQVSVFSVLISLLVGVFLGEMAGLLGGFVDSIIMRLMDVILAFPALLLAIVIVAFLGPGLTNAMLAIGIVGIPAYARLSRSMAIAIREEEFVEASRSLGASTWRILFRHVLPNSLAPIIVQTTLSLGIAVVETAALGFLGLGQQPPFPEWGKMLAESQRFLLTGSWWALVFPGAAIMLTVLGFNLLGDGLRDVLDPRLAKFDVE